MNNETSQEHLERGVSINSEATDNGQSVIEEQTPEITAEESTALVRKQFLESLTKVAKNFRGMFGFKPFSIYEITKRTQMKDSTEVFAMLEMMEEEFGLVNKTGEGKDARYTVNLDLRSQLDALQVRRNVVVLQLEGLDADIEQIKEAIELMKKNN